MNPARPLRLDGDLFQIYASYKKATNYVIRWLTASCNPGLARSCFSSVREMRHLANQIISSGIPIPTELITIFHKAIEARKQLASYYCRSSNIFDHKVAETHVYFNETFAEIYKDLAYARKQTNRDCSHSKVPPNDLSTAPSNLFEYLSSSDDSSEQSDESSSEPCNDKTLPLSGDMGIRNRGTANMPAIEGDALEEVASIHAHLAQLDQLATTVEQSYHEAAESRRWCARSYGEWKEREVGLAKNE